jgi:hypothetical protein
VNGSRSDFAKQRLRSSLQCKPASEANSQKQLRNVGRIGKLLVNFFSLQESDQSLKSPIVTNFGELNQQTPKNLGELNQQTPKNLGALNQQTPKNLGALNQQIPKHLLAKMSLESYLQNCGKN